MKSILILVPTNPLTAVCTTVHKNRALYQESSQPHSPPDTSNMADLENDTKNQQLQTFKTELENLLEKSLAKGDAW